MHSCCYNWLNMPIFSITFIIQIFSVELLSKEINATQRRAGSRANENQDIELLTECFAMCVLCVQFCGIIFDCKYLWQLYLQ